MNSVTGGTPQRGGAPSPSSVSLNTYQFDFDLGLSGRGSSSSRPLKDQKLNPSAATNPISSSSTATPKPAAPSWTHQPNKPSWTHQPAPRSGPSNPPASMVGDIYGKSWASAAPPAATSRIGIPDNNPRLFGDLVGSALGQSKAGVGGNAPLKASAPRNSYSMGSLSDSLPKATNTTANPPMKPSSASVDNLRNYSSANQAGSKIGNPLSGGPPLKSSSVAQMKPKKDPFGSLLDFGSKPSGNPPLSAANSANSGNGGGADYSLGSFQNAKMDEFGKPDLGFSAPPANSSNSGSSNDTDFSFGTFKNAKTDGFGSSDQSFSAPTTQQQSAQSKGDPDPLDVLFSSPISSAPAATAPAGASGGPPFSELNDWDLGSEFGGNDTGGGTTELEGLPPPPAGVTVSAAKTKGLDNYKQGQFADAIKWLSWAVVLLEKSGGSAASIEILSCRASCYKEVGEYKKAVADCSKVLEHDSVNVSVLLQRALLYESTEKYKLGAEDLRMVLKIDPGNRLARSTIHRLNKLAG